MALGVHPPAKQLMSWEWRLNDLTPHGLLSKSLVIDRQHCLVANNNYTRWEKVWPEAREFFGLVLPVIWKALPITAIGLQYTDIFTWRGNKQDFDLSFLFNPESELLPKHIFNRNSLWHVHQGYFDDSPEEHGIEYNTLNNININLLPFHSKNRQSARVIISFNIKKLSIV